MSKEDYTPKVLREEPKCRATVRKEGSEEFEEGLFGPHRFTADEGLLEELKSYSYKKDPAAILPPPKVKAEDFSVVIPPWEHDHAKGMATMKEILGKDYGMIESPRVPEMAMTPRDEKIIPVRAARRMPARAIGALRRSMEVAQINEYMVSELMPPLLKQLDEMGLIDLQITQVTPETLEYSLILKVVKDERG